MTFRWGRAALLGGLILLGAGMSAAAQMSEDLYQDYLETAQACGQAQPRERACGGTERFPDSVRQSFLDRARAAGASGEQLRSLGSAWDTAASETAQRLSGMRLSCPTPPPSGPSPMVAGCAGE